MPESRHLRPIEGIRPTPGMLALGMFAMLAGCGTSSTPDAAKAPVPVTIASAEQGPQALAMNGLGHVEGRDTAAARAQTSGVVLSISFTEGQTVRAGQPLAQIDPRPLQATIAQDEAALARDRAALANANDLVTRNAPLVDKGLVSAQQVMAYRSQSAQLSAVVAGDRATIVRDRLTLAYATIRAPITGVTGVRLVDPGNLVSPTDPTGIVTIAQIQPIAATFTLPQGAIAQIRAAMAAAGPAGLGVTALAQGSGQVLAQGHLTVIDNRIDATNGMISLKAVFPNEHKQLWPGEQINFRIALGDDVNAVTVPASALQSNPQGTYVWVVCANDTVAMRPVTSGRRFGDRIEIVHGLSGRDRVVTDGQFALSPGASVTIADKGAAKTSLRSDNPDQLGLQP